MQQAARQQQQDPANPLAHTATIHLLIPNQCMGSIIGRGGSKIKYLQESSRSRITASQDMLPNSTERLVTLQGTPDAIHVAAFHIAAILVDSLFSASGNGGHPSGSGVSADPRYGGLASGRGNDDKHGNMQIHYYVPLARHMGLLHHYDQAKGVHRSVHPPPSHPHHPSSAGGGRGMMATAAAMYGHPHVPQHGHHPHHPPPTHPHPATNPYHPAAAFMPPPTLATTNAGGLTPQQPTPSQQALMAASAARSSTHTTGGAALSASASTHLMPHTGAASATTATATGTTTQHLYIPVDMVGAVIGKAGAKINEIRHLSGAHIKISDTNGAPTVHPAKDATGGGGERHRLVTIMGTPVQNQHALYMLYARLEEEKTRLQALGRR